MATLMIRELDETVYERLLARAEANGRSVEDEARDMLHDRASDHAAWAAEVRTLSRAIKDEHGVFPDSVALIRQVRDEE